MTSMEIQFFIYFFLLYFFFYKKRQSSRKKCWMNIFHKTTHLVFMFFLNFTFSSSSSFIEEFFFDSFENWKNKKNYQEKRKRFSSLCFFFIFFPFSVLYTFRLLLCLMSWKVIFRMRKCINKCLGIIFKKTDIFFYLNLKSNKRRRNLKQSGLNLQVWIDVHKNAILKTKIFYAFFTKDPAFWIPIVNCHFCFILLVLFFCRLCTAIALSQKKY